MGIKEVSGVIHGHFYQPWRIAPFSRIPHTLIARQKKEPNPGKCFNWTELIAQQCYLALMNGDPAQSAYRHMSFNFGPTLIEQLKILCPGFLGQLIEADSLSRNAIAQAFFHTILPLDMPQDQLIQVAWGKDYFSHTFKRTPEAMWLPEAAVSLELLSFIAALGMKYAIISPTAVKRVKELGTWKDVKLTAEGRPDLLPGQPYQVRGLDPNFYVFVFDPELYHLTDQTEFLNAPPSPNWVDVFRKRLGQSGFITMATDGEFFGHHRKKGAENLLALFHQKNPGIRFTNYGTVLEEALCPPREVGVIELNPESSWSCSHGFGRWDNGCGCNKENEWRRPLREALQWLALQFDDTFIKETQTTFPFPLKPKVKYIQVLTGAKTFHQFLAEQSVRPNLTPAEFAIHSALCNAMVPRYAMFVSCAWFFEGMGLEADISLGFAAELARTLLPFKPKIEQELRSRLALVKNPGHEKRHQLPDAAHIYDNIIALAA
ncbi:MAG: DUF3536 domain-containing protein [Candidatus Saganbacteria bacterium]|nr:DUF3536 domain-containing protein [Candidatus Saganbacteria bacterium]